MDDDNPVEDQIRILFDLKQSEKINVELLDVTGNNVAVIHNGQLQKGSNVINYQTEGLSAGIYFIRINGESTSKTIKLIKQ